MTSSWFVILTILAALLFDFLNGFHDAANSIATIVSTRVLQPLVAVIWAAFFNFIAFLIFGPRVAETIRDIINIEPDTPIYVALIFSGVIAASLWNILTWWLGLPTSSSHALIGGLSGAAFVYGGAKLLMMSKLIIIVLFIFISPLLGLLLSYLIIWLLYWVCQSKRPGFLSHFFRKGQLVSAALYSIGHGANDAQKTMGVILAVLIAAGKLQPNVELSWQNSKTLWIVLSCQAAISLGTLCGGWRIVKTMGMKITKLRPIGGFSAEMASACSLFLATLLGIPVSTTHTITGAIVGVGAATTSLSRVKWLVAAKIIWAWIFTIPGSALIAALLFVFIKFLISWPR